MIKRYISFFTLLKRENGMAMRESSPLNILAGETDRVSFYKQGTVSKHFTHAPVKLRSVLYHCFMLGKELNSFIKKLFIGRQGSDLFSNFTEDSFINACFGRSFKILISCRP